MPAVGDLLKLNANVGDFCDSPDLRTARVVAVTDKAIVVADTAIRAVASPTTNTARSA